MPELEPFCTMRGLIWPSMVQNGNMDLDIHAVIGEKRDSVGYTATGVSVVLEDQSAEINELLKFHTGSEDLAWLNDRIGVAIGRGAEGKITLEVYLVKRA